MFNFMKYRYLYFAISLLVIIPGLIALVMFGLRPAIDFTGGSLLEISFPQPPSQPVTIETVGTVTQDLYQVTSVQTSGVDQYLIRGTTINNDVKNIALEALQAQFGPVTEIRFETLGPTLGRELIVKTVIAALLAATIITLYVARQFKELKYGVSAVLAMLHDSLVLLGIFSLLGKFFQVEVDVLFVTALLTTLSFSVHDTIVVYDRIREFKRLHPKLTMDEVINGAVLQTLGRSLNNSLTIIIMLLALALLGGETIRWFVVALLIGAVTGTYSSTFTAAPLLLLWDQVAKKIRKST